MEKSHLTSILNTALDKENCKIITNAITLCNICDNDSLAKLINVSPEEIVRLIKLIIK